MEALARQNWTDDRLEERFDHLDGEIATLRVELKAGNAELRREIKEGNAQLRKEMTEGNAQLRRDLKEDAASLRAEMHIGDAAVKAEIATLNRVLIQTGFGMAIAFGAAVLAHLL